MDPGNLVLNVERLRALARSLVRDAAAADDVIQEACLAALRRGNASRPWLVGVVRNLARRRHRDEARRAERERRAARPEASAADDQAVERAELQRALLDELLALEEPYRSAMLLRHVDGLAHREIARRLRVPAGTVAARLHRGLDLLRGRLDGRFGGRVAWCLLFLPLLGRPSMAAWGGVAVSTKKIATIAALLLLALGALVTTLAMRSGGAQGARSGRPTAQAAPAPAPEEADGLQAPPAGLAKVDRDLDLFGVVVDAGGAPVANARVESFWFPWRQRVWTSAPDALNVEAHGPFAATAPDGTFALRLRRGQQVNLRTSAPGFAMSELTCFQAGERVRIVLGAGVRMVIECVDEAGAPVPGARLHLYRDEAGSAGHNFADRRGETGADGRCAFDGLPAGEWAYVDGRHERRAGIWKRVPFPATGEAVVRLVLSPGRTLRGTVRDAETGAPIPGARVGASLQTAEHVTTDEKGRYELEGFGTEGTVTSLDATANGYARLSRFVGPQDVQDLELKRGCELRGHVVGADGAPVGRALVAVRGVEGNYLATCEQGTTSADGTFLLAGVACGITNTLTVLAEGRGRLLLDFASPAGPAPIDLGAIVLPASHALEGRVLLPDGTAAPGILVRLEGGNTDRGRLLEGGPSGMSNADREERRSDDLGRFRFRDLPPGAYTLTCASAGWKPLPLDVTVPEDGDATGIELKLAAGHELAVRVVDADERPVWGMFVRVKLADDWWLQSMTDAAGVARFRADTAFESVDDVSDYLDQFRYATPPPCPLPSGATDITIRLEPVGVAEGIVLDPAGNPLPQAALRVVSGGKSFSQGMGAPWSDLEGRFRVAVPAHATSDIVLIGVVNRIDGVHAGEIPPFAGKLTGVVAGAKDLVLRARPLTFDRTLLVRVLAPDGSPLRGAQVFARDATGGLVPGANVLTDPDGIAALKALPDGDLSVWAKAVRLAIAEDWMEASLYPLLAEGQTVTLRIRQGLRVRGEVTAADGEPVPGAYLTAYRGADMLQTVQTGLDGRFSLLVPADTQMPLRLIAQKWEAETLLQATIEAWTPERGDVAMALTPGE